jgi:ribosome assembly protein 1
MAPTKTPNVPRGTIHGFSSLNIVRFTIRASPLPGPILGFILENIDILKKLQDDKKMRDSQALQDKVIIEEAVNIDVHGDIVRKPTVSPEQFWGTLQKICDDIGGEWGNIVERIWALGPHGAGGCLLIDARKLTTTSFVYVLYSRFDDD